MSESQETLRWSPNTPVSAFRTRKDVSESVLSSKQTLRNPVGLTATSTEKEEDDKYSDENVREWIEEDKLENQDPRLVEWLVAQLGQ